MRTSTSTRDYDRRPASIEKNVNTIDKLHVKHLINEINKLSMTKKKCFNTEKETKQQPTREQTNILINEKAKASNVPTY